VPSSCLGAGGELLEGPFGGPLKKVESYGSYVSDPKEKPSKEEEPDLAAIIAKNEAAAVEIA